MNDKTQLTIALEQGLSALNLAHAVKYDHPSLEAKVDYLTQAMELLAEATQRLVNVVAKGLPS